MAIPLHRLRSSLLVRLVRMRLNVAACQQWGRRRTKCFELACGSADTSSTYRVSNDLGANSIERYQDFGGFPFVPDQQLKRWANMLERHTED